MQGATLIIEILTARIVIRNYQLNSLLNKVLICIRIKIQFGKEKLHFLFIRACVVKKRLISFL